MNNLPSHSKRTAFPTTREQSTAGQTNECGSVSQKDNEMIKCGNPSEAISDSRAPAEFPPEYYQAVGRAFFEALGDQQPDKQQTPVLDEERRREATELGQLGARMILAIANKSWLKAPRKVKAENNTNGPIAHKRH